MPISGGVLIAVLGVRGAGKSSLINRLRKDRVVKVVRPTTSRLKRDSDAEDEYEYVDQWPCEGMAWSIDVGGKLYGVRASELECLLRNECAVTVFDPASVETLLSYSTCAGHETVLIGLDTVSKAEDQSSRVGKDATREMQQDEIDNQRELLNSKCDAVLTGNSEVVYAAFLGLLRILMGRGGLLGKSEITALINAEVLLVGGDSAFAQSASYDLRLGWKHWLGGKIREAERDSDAISIPPYSYVVVEALERAKMPRFVVGHFDLRVSLFFKGIVLSNGPQVDPGYQGALFCMLYNGGDEAVHLTAGHHFATIDFTSTVRTTDGYRQEHAGKTKYVDFMDGETIKRGGANLLGRLTGIQAQVDSLRKWFYLALAITVPSLLGLAIWAGTTITDVGKQQSELARQSVELAKQSNELNKQTLELKSAAVELERTHSELRKLRDEIRGIVDTFSKQRKDAPAGASDSNMRSGGGD